MFNNYLNVLFMFIYIYIYIDTIQYALHNKDINRFASDKIDVQS